MSDSVWVFLIALTLGLLIGAGVILFARKTPGMEAPPGTVDEPELTLDSFLEVLPQDYIIVSASGSVDDASTLAYALGLVRGTRITRSELVDYVERARQTGETFDGELTMRKSLGDNSATVILGLRVTEMAGKVLILITDNTGAKRLEETRRDFVANISHELKTPIGAISLLAETIEDCAEEPENIRMFAGQLHKESGRLSGLVQDIIQLSRIQDSDGKKKSEIVEIDDVIAEAIDWSKMEATKRDVSIVSGKPNGLTVYGDAATLTTAVRNLLDNAVRYSPTGSRVAVGVSQADGFVRIAVVDQGVGIPADQQLRVFERFYRGDEARTADLGGSGLGLSIVKHVAADHGGRVELWSEPGKGSTFTLIIPSADDVEEEA